MNELRIFFGSDPGHLVKIFIEEKNTKKVLCSPLSRDIFSLMKNWIPRSERWTQAQREEKKIEAKNKREFSCLLWQEANAIREQIQKEIEHILIAKRASLD